MLDVLSFDPEASHLSNVLQKEGLIHPPGLANAVPSPFLIPSTGNGLRYKGKIQFRNLTCLFLTVDVFGLWPQLARNDKLLTPWPSMVCLSNLLS